MYTEEKTLFIKELTDLGLAYSLQEIPYVALTLIIAFTIHELAHAYVAYKFGDPTAKNQGRITLNPMKHLDPIGTILIFVAGFGWARPVPVNRFFFKNPRLAGILVTVAGPVSNFLLACLGFAFLYGMAAAGILQSIPSFVPIFFETFIELNVVLFVFNLLPFPPLDGYRIIEDLVPTNLRVKMTEVEKYGSLLFLVLVITPLSNYTIQPIFNVAMPFILENMSYFFEIIFNL